MSFDSPWRWTDGQFAGFQEGLAIADAKFRVFQMNVKKNSTPEAKARVGAEARQLVDEWKPDLIYTSDDDALTHVSSHFAGQSLPCVFSGVNKTPAQHGIEGAPNIAGVLEQEHFVQSVALLRQISPAVKRLAVVGDLGPQWPPVIARIRRNMARLPECELVAVEQVPDFAGFRQAVAGFQESADAIVQLGIYMTQRIRTWSLFRLSDFEWYGPVLAGNTPLWQMLDPVRSHGFTTYVLLATALFYFMAWRALRRLEL